MEVRKILRQYLFSLVIILCLAAFFIGTVRVKEKTRYNMDMTPYETVEIEKGQGRLSFYYKEREYTLKTDYAEKIRNSLKENFIFDFRQIFS